MVRSLIFGNFWNRISVDHADISARKMAAFFVCDFFMAVVIAAALFVVFLVMEVTHFL